MFYYRFYFLLWNFNPRWNSNMYVVQSFNVIVESYKTFVFLVETIKQTNSYFGAMPWKATLGSFMGWYHLSNLVTGACPGLWDHIPSLSKRYQWKSRSTATKEKNRHWLSTVPFIFIWRTVLSFSTMLISYVFVIAPFVAFFSIVNRLSIDSIDRKYWLSINLKCTLFPGSLPLR